MLGVLHRLLFPPPQGTQSVPQEQTKQRDRLPPTHDLARHQLFGSHEEYSSSKRAFLDAHGHAYGYGQPTADGPSEQAGPRHIDAVRSEELQRLHGQAYLDHGGAAPYSERQLEDAFEELKTQLLTNPHSVHGPGSPSAEADAELRRLTLGMLHACGQDYEVIFTSGATAALKLVGECFPWSPSSSLTYTLHNHNSALGLREYALREWAQVHAVDLLMIDEQQQQQQPGFAGVPMELGEQQQHNQPEGQQPQQQGVQHQQEHSLSGQRLGPYVLRHCSSLRRPAAATSLDTAAPPTPPISSPATSHQSVPAASPVDPEPQQPPCHLLVLPLECNFSGIRYHLDAASAAQAHGLRHVSHPHQAPDGGAAAPSTAASPGRSLVLLDAAKGCSTAPPDLSAHPVDFVALSYYKIFGYPTGLGALVVRKDALPLLRKRYFAGGTVLVSVADEDFVRRRPGHAGLEDGTLSFTAIAAARHGFRFISRLGGFSAVSRHAGTLAQHLADSLRALRYSNGRHVAELYGWQAPVSAGLQGPTVAFNLLRADGGYVGYGEVRSLASLHGLHLRGGCFCNPGACAKFLGLSGNNLRENFKAGHVCWDDQDLVNGRPTGAVRVSLGATTTFEEVYLLLRLIHHYLVQPELEQAQQAQQAQHAQQAQRAQQDTLACSSDSQQSLSLSAPNRHAQATGCDAAQPCPAAGVSSLNGSCPAAERPAGRLHTCGILTHMFLYPVKSCAPQQVSAWPVGATGLLFDREWALLDDSGKVLTQKACPRMAALTPVVDLQAGTLTLSFPGCPRQLVVKVHSSATQAPRSANGKPQLPHVTEAQGAGANDPEGGDVNVQQQQQLESIQVCGDRVCGLVVGELMVAVSSSSSGVSAMPGDAANGSGSPNAPASLSDQTEARRDADAVRAWCMEVLGVPCRLVRQTAGARVTKRTDVKVRGAVPAPDKASGVAAGGAAAGSDAAAGSIAGRSIASGSTASGSTAAGSGTAVAVAGVSGSKGGRQEGAAAPPQQRVPAGASGSNTGGLEGAPPQPHQQQASASSLGQHVGFANDGQYLLVNAASIADLNARLEASGRGRADGKSGQGSPGGQGGEGQAGGGRAADERRFRPNLVAEGFEAYAEDRWAEIQVGSLRLDVLGTCPRCEMLQVDQESGTRGPADILIELAQYRRLGGKMHFGVLLAAADGGAVTPPGRAPGLLEGSGRAGVDTGGSGSDQVQQLQEHRHGGAGDARGLGFGAGTGCTTGSVLRVGMPIVAYS